ncbi:putative glycolate oxidase subunit GlcE [Synechococcus sp. RS9916]|nr:putative glycolate oxidase subunit GlcE [Synechococcus sp. RS9916]
MVRDLHASASPWIPSGLGSRLSWGAPLKPAPVLSLRHCKAVLDHAVDDLTITLQAGLPLADLQAQLAEHQQWLPVDWPFGTNLKDADSAGNDSAGTDSAGSVGGLVARGLAGGLRHRHLGVRDQIIGIGLIRSDGTEAHAGGRVVKNVAGYDLMRLLCGSWGSLALISELTLRVQPIRPARALLMIHGPLEALEAWRADVVASTLTPELLNWQCGPAQPLRIQVGVASVSDAAVEDQLNRLRSLAEHHQLSAEPHPWEGPLPPAESSTTATPPWLLRLALAPTQVQALFRSAELQALQGWHWQVAAAAGSGDGWVPTDGATRCDQLKSLRQRVETLGGRLSVLRQPSASTKAIDAWTDAPSRPLIEAVKRQFDPLQQLNRGRLPGVAHPYG